MNTRYFATRKAGKPDENAWGVWDAIRNEWASPPSTTLSGAKREAVRLTVAAMPDHFFVRCTEKQLFTAWAYRDKKSALARKINYGKLTEAGVAVKVTASERATLERYQHCGEWNA